MVLDRLEGKLEELKGTIKERWGKYTKNPVLTIQGRGEQLRGSLCARFGYTKDEVESAMNPIYRSFCQNGKHGQVGPANK